VNLLEEALKEMYKESLECDLSIGGNPSEHKEAVQTYKREEINL
jgi:hypothetical protein